MDTLLLEAQSQPADDPQQTSSIVDLQRLIASSESVEWRRSKIMIVGEGRAGKTAVANAVMGKAFVPHSASTVGLEELTCEVKYAAVGSEKGQWSQRADDGTKETEAVLAERLAEEMYGRNKRLGGGRGNRKMEDLLADSRSKEGGDKDKRTDKEEEEEGDAAQKPLEGSDANRTRDANASSATTNQAAASSNDLAHTSSGALNDNDNDTTDATSTVHPKAAIDVTPQSIDLEAIQQLADKIQTQSNVVIGLFDLGGQSVFDVIHHLYMTRYGVYLVVFDMQWLLETTAGSERDKCLSTLSFWVNSIVLHTWDDGRSFCAPVVFVGTHKDAVSDRETHEAISQLLEDRFGKHEVWRSVVKDNDDANGPLHFFPVDCTQGRSDAVVSRLMEAIEGEILASDYLYAMKPLTWVKVLDQVNTQRVASTNTNTDRNTTNSSGRSDVYMSYSDIQAIATSCGVTREGEVDVMLRFFHEMGVLIWHEDEKLRDVAIVDIVGFIGMITRVICKFLPSKEDRGGPDAATRHHQSLRDQCYAHYANEMKKFEAKGIAHRNLIDFMLSSHSSYAAYKEATVQLMVKFGLLVPISEDQYVVPSQLPESDKVVSEDWCSLPTTTSFYIACSRMDLSEDDTVTIEADLKPRAFLPRGLFERLLQKAIGWSQVSSAIVPVAYDALFKNGSVLSIGNQRFRIVPDFVSNVLRVDTEGRYAIAVESLLSKLVREVASECLRGLQATVLLPYTTSSAAEKDALFFPLSRIQKAKTENKLPFNMVGRRGNALFASVKELCDHYSNWLLDANQLSQFDVFLSYRRADFNSFLVEAIYNSLVYTPCGRDSHAMRIFLDKYCLPVGQQLRNKCFEALLKSSVIVLLLTSDSLEKMSSASFKADKEDNVLIEWMTSAEYGLQNRNVSIIPVLVGKIEKLESPEHILSPSEVFDFEKGFSALSKDIPSRSIAIARKQLEMNGVKPTLRNGGQYWFEGKNVKEIVEDVSKMNTGLVAKKGSKIPHDIVKSLYEAASNRLSSNENSILSTSIVNTNSNIRYSDVNIIPTHGNIPLVNLPYEDLQSLVLHKFGPAVSKAFAENGITASILGTACREDLLELGLRNIHVNSVLQCVEDWNKHGVPSDLLQR